MSGNNEYIMNVQIHHVHLRISELIVWVRVFFLVFLSLVLLWYAECAGCIYKWIANEWKIFSSWIEEWNILVNKSYSSGSAHSMDAEWFGICCIAARNPLFLWPDGARDTNRLSQSAAFAYARFERAIVGCVQAFLMALAQTDETHREKNLYSRRTGNIRWHRGLWGFPRENRLSLTNGKWRAAQASSGSDALCTIELPHGRNCTEPSILWNWIGGMLRRIVKIGAHCNCLRTSRCTRIR